MNYQKVIFDCEKTFIEMKRGKGKHVELDKLDLAIKVINEFIVNNEIESNSQYTWRENL